VPTRQGRYGQRVHASITVELFKKLKPLETADYPFASLPEKHAGRWGTGLTAAKMEECRWLKPVLVAQFRICGMDPGRPPEARPIHVAAR
jgi:hypothetical protein